MRCAQCGAFSDLEDNFCRRCGITLNRHDLPTVVSHSFLPVPWTLAKGPVMRGIAALMVGAAVELVRRELERRFTSGDPSQALASLAAAKPIESRRGRFPWSRPPRGDYEVTDTVIQRRVRFFKR